MNWSTAFLVGCFVLLVAAAVFLLRRPRVPAVPPQDDLPETDRSHLPAIEPPATVQATLLPAPVEARAKPKPVPLPTAVTAPTIPLSFQSVPGFTPEERAAWLGAMHQDVVEPVPPVQTEEPIEAEAPVRTAFADHLLAAMPDGLTHEEKADWLANVRLERKALQEAGEAGAQAARELLAQHAAAVLATRHPEPSGKQAPAAIPPAPRKKAVPTDMVLRSGLSQQLFLRYRDAKQVVTDRIVQASLVRGDRADGPITVLQAHCFTAQARRSFRRDRIVAVGNGDTGEVIEDLDVFLLGRAANPPYVAPPTPPPAEPAFVDEDAEDDAPPPVKRKRGRPRKVVVSGNVTPPIVAVVLATMLSGMAFAQPLQGAGPKAPSKDTIESDAYIFALVGECGGLQERDALKPLSQFVEQIRPLPKLDGDQIQALFEEGLDRADRDLKRDRRATCNQIGPSLMNRWLALAGGTVKFVDPDYKGSRR